MPFTIQLTGFTLGASILNVDLYACTGSLAQCTGGTAYDLSNYFLMTGYTNIPKASLNGAYVVVPDGIKSLKVKVSNTNDGGCVECTELINGDFCNLTIISPNTPTPTPTPTATPNPCSFDANIIYGLINTPTPTPTTTPNCSFDAVVEYGLVSTATPTPTPTATSVSTATPTPTPTATSVSTATPTPTPTATTIVDPPTQTPTPTPTATTIVDPPTQTPTPTPTATIIVDPPTDTPTPTPTGYYEFTIYAGAAGTGSGTACYNAANDIGTPYYVWNEFGYLVDTGTVFIDSLGTTPFAGGPGTGGYYSDGSTYGKINNSGYYTQDMSCI